MEKEENKPTQVAPYPPIYYYPDDEITLKELILKIKEYLREFQRNFLLILLITAATIALGFAYSQYKGNDYKTTLSYQIDNAPYIGGFNALVPNTLHLEISNEKLASLLSEDEFYQLLLQEPFGEALTLKEKILTQYPHLIMEDERATQFKIKNHLHRVIPKGKGTEQLGLIQLNNNQLAITSLPEPSVKVIQRATIPEIIGTSISKIIVISGLLGLS